MIIKNFKDIIGNQSTVSLLQRSVARKTLNNFIIIEGVNGTGKSSSALLTAMALTCDNPVNGNPCLCCPSCKAIMSIPPGNASTSNFSRVNIPTKTTDKDFDALLNEIFVLQNTEGNSVYVFEEAHAIRNENSQEKLLDKIDHMPKNVYIIMTTTELYKLITPLRSRALVFSFSRLNHYDSELLLDMVQKEHGVKLTHEQRRLLLEESHGIPRDLIKLVEFTLENEVTLAELRDFLKNMDKQFLIELFATMLDVNTFNTITCLDTLCSQFSASIMVKQLKVFILDVIYYMEAGIRGEYTSNELKEISEIFDKKPLMQMASLIEKLNRSSTEEDLKFLVLKLRSLMQKGNPTGMLKQNTAMAKQQSLVAQDLKRDKDSISASVKNTNDSDKLTKESFLQQTDKLKQMELWK